MMLPIDVKANNAQIVITSKGDIYYQEFRTLNRPKSNRVLIGHLEMINDEIMPIFSEWDMFDSIAFELSHNQKLLDSAKAAKAPKEKIDEYQENVDSCKVMYDCDPLKDLLSLNSSVSNAVYKAVGKAAFKQQVKLDGSRCRFIPLQTNEAFLESEAKALLKRHNETLEAKGIETGFMDLDQARETIQKRFSKVIKSTVAA